MEKPEKKEVLERIHKDCRDYKCGRCSYNQAIEEYEEYHNYVLSKLPSEKELYNISFNTSLTSRGCDPYETKFRNYDPIEYHERIAKAIAKRIGKE